MNVNKIEIDKIPTFPSIRKVLWDFVFFLREHLDIENKNSTAAILGNKFGGDAKMLEFAFEKHVPELELATHGLFRRVIEMGGVVHHALRDWKLYGQGRLGEKLLIPNERAHSALGDAEQMFMIYRFIMLNFSQDQKEILGNLRRNENKFNMEAFNRENLL